MVSHLPPTRTRGSHPPTIESPSVEKSVWNSQKVPPPPPQQLSLLPLKNRAGTPKKYHAELHLNFRSAKSCSTGE